MKGYSKFLDYIKDKFYDEIVAKCDEYINIHKAFLILEPKDITRAENIEIANLDFIKIYIEDLPNDDIAFDVVVVPEVAFSYYDSRCKDWDTDSIRTTWLIVPCKGTVGKENLVNFKIVNNIEEHSKHKSKKPLDGDLVPIISSDQYDAVAEAFLSKYYPEALNQDTPLDTDKLVNNMGLKLIYRRINKEASVFGESFFEDTVAKFYDEANDILYLSVRSLAIMAVDYSEWELIWYMADDTLDTMESYNPYGRYLKDLKSFDPYKVLGDGNTDGPKSQHALFLISTNVIAMFDNQGDEDENPNGSRYVEYKITGSHGNWKAEKIYEYKTADKLYSHYISDVDYLTNGNILLDFGNNSQIMEVNKETKEVLYQLKFGLKTWGIYRIDKMPFYYSPEYDFNEDSSLIK